MKNNEEKKISRWCNIESILVSLKVLYINILSIKIDIVKPNENQGMCYDIFEAKKPAKSAFLSRTKRAAALCDK